MIRLRVCAAIALAGLVAIVLSAPRPADTATPADFTDTLVTAVAAPTALAFTPDGRMLITTQQGPLRVFSSGALVAAPALDLSASVCNGEEQGLLGVTVDPSFTSNGFVYLYYTNNRAGTCENRVSRFTMSGNTLSAASELVLVDGIPSPAGNHNAGDLHFGNDGFLYVSVGDGGCDYLGDSGCAGANDASRDQNVLVGKVLRITSSGGIPPTNPFQGAGTARCNVTGRTTPGSKCQETYAWGLRNPFRLAFDPNTSATRFFINDVGQNDREEIDLGQAGADYGWNVREGTCCGAKPAGMTDPIFEYVHSGGCAAITGGAFVPSGVWPATYDGTYIYADYVCGQLFVLRQAADSTYSASGFATGNGAPVEVIFGPYAGTQALYYTNYNSGGEVRRIVYTGNTNRTPTAAVTASPASGPVPLTVNFDASASSDPDTGDTLSYRWSFGDGTANSQTSTPTTQHVYSTSGVYTASLTVVDNHGAASQPATARIDSGNSPPTPKIDVPTASFRFKVGQTIQLRGSATDAEDGTLPGTSLSWTVIKHHATHTHPFLPPTGGSAVDIVGPAPEDAAAAANSYLEVQLTATDSRGLSRTTTMNVLPAKVNVTLATSPAGLRLELFGQTATSPLVAWEGWQLALNAPDQFDTSGKGWVFSSWSDAGPRAHTVTVPGTDATYTATFAAGAPAPTGLVAAYGFDENNGGAIADSSGKANNGTAANTTWAAGKFGSALSFNGSSSRVNVPDSASLDLTSASTVEAWVKPTVVSNWRTIAAKERAGGILYTLYASESTNKPVAQLDIGGEQNATGSTSLAANTWTHLAATWDGSVLRLYVNGVQVASKTVAGTLAASTGPLSIGGNTIWGEYFAGLIDELRVYDHALSPAEIQNDMNRPIGSGGGGPPPDTTPPTAPGQPAASVTGSSVALSWPAATDTGSGIARYRIHRSTTSGFTPAAANQVGTATGTSYTDTGLAAGTYYYKVVAEDVAGNVGPPSAQAQATIQAQPPPPPTSGLVAAYGFDENTGTTIADSSGNANNGTAANTTWTTGKFGSALSFNGTSSWVTVADSSSLHLTRGLTLEAWVKPTDLSGWATVALKERTGGMLYSLYANNSGSRPVGQVWLGSERNAQGSAKLPVNAWTHLATTWDGTTMRIYANGAQVGSAAVSGTLGSSTGPFRIGGNGIWREYFSGLIDELRLYDHALTATEIQTDMQRAVSAGGGAAPGAPTPQAGLVAAYNFDEASGAAVNDASGLGNNGTTAGGPTRVAGHSGGSLSFDGVDDVVTVPGTASLALTSGMTVEAWVKPTELGSMWRTVALKEQSGDLCYALYAHDGTGATGHVYIGSEWRARGDALTLNAWTHLAVTYDGSVLALYRDGALVTTTLVSGLLATSSGPLKIGGNGVWQEPFAGQIDDLRIYDRALSAGQIADDMQRPA